ncbi:MAG TPA: tetratricopeptide repeat protein [Vicinamibacterales bacterium]|nr:tetratricopeptide repeat protein [Vicinamibacterales bacterium]
MRLLAGTFAAVLLVHAVLGAQSQRRILLDITTTRKWVERVERHTPGTLDDAAAEIAEWPAADLEAALNGLRRYGSDVAREGRQNHILRRGALLHTDIAILDPARAAAFRGWSTSARLEVVLGMDGRDLGSGSVSAHWEFARTLLAMVAPHPREDGFVRRWYRAVAGYQLKRLWLGIVPAHLEQALRLFPDDADLLFLKGGLHETFASSRCQPIRRRQPVTFGSAREEHERAARAFSRALASNPDLIEARVRLGRVLGQLGRHEEAARELRAAAPVVEDPLLQYYAALFLGAEEAALGRTDAARASFERGASLFPTAQSARLALSALALRSGDDAGALRALREAAALPSDRDDPWWTYHVAYAAAADTLLDELRADAALGPSR